MKWRFYHYLSVAAWLVAGWFMLGGVVDLARPPRWSEDEWWLLIVCALAPWLGAIRADISPDRVGWAVVCSIAAVAVMWIDLRAARAIDWPELGICFLVAAAVTPWAARD